MEKDDEKNVKQEKPQGQLVLPPRVRNRLKSLHQYGWMES